MRKPTIKLLKGRKGLNDWFEFVFRVCNHFDIKLSLFGYGFEFNWILKEPLKRSQNEDSNNRK